MDTIKVASEVRSALSIFNAAYKNNTDRTEKIKTNRKKMKQLKAAVDEYNELNEEIKQLLKENERDRKYVSETIAFYEKQTENSVQVGDLFRQEDNN